MNTSSLAQGQAPSRAAVDVPMEERTYQNNDFAQRVLTEMALAHNTNTVPQSPTTASLYKSATTAPPAEPKANEPTEENTGPDHDYYNDMSLESSETTLARKRPENLKLNDVETAILSQPDLGEPSPALSTSSGPYIPICECFSGSPVLPNGFGRGAGASYENNFAPLNSLSRNGRMDVPKSPLNIGQLNLTEGPPQSPRVVSTAGEGGIASDVMRSSDESESVFTDDDGASSNSGSHVSAPQYGTMSETQLRRLRPSDSSIENENIGWTAMQRYSKLPAEEKKCLNSNDPPPRPPKRCNEGVVGPLDSSSCVAEERYEIPRSHRNPNYSTVKVATPNDSEDATAVEPTPTRRSHFYTNAAPSNLEGSVFRYDFSEASDAVAMPPPPPAINRNLKPKPGTMHAPSKSCDQIETPTHLGGSRASLLLRPGQRQSLQMTPSRSDDKLQYLDLDHTGAPLPPRPESIRSVTSTSAQNIHAVMHVVGLPMPPPPVPQIKHSASEHVTLGTAAGPGSSSGHTTSAQNTVYKTVDFVKTEAFNRTRQDAEMNRAVNKDK